MELMKNRIRPYAWGSRTAIAELTGAPAPSPHPQAELWMGAHPGDPSVLESSDVSLLDAIAEHPRDILGGNVISAFGDRLPYLFKVLAAAEPLSLQAHPSPAQAREGFRREERAGIPLSAAARNYKDDQAKPELICALTEFQALCGFRDPAVTVEMLTELGVPQLDHYLALLSGQPDAHGVRALFSSFVTVPSAALGPLLSAVVAACVERIRGDSAFTTEYRTALELGERYPGDPGVLASLLLNRVTLQPGEALYLAAGNLHAYLSGVGVELMANSDNVLRGGLTPKHVDVPELMKVLDFTAGPVTVLTGNAQGDGEIVYPTPAPEFRLSRFTLPGPDSGPGSGGVTQGISLRHDGPQVVLVVDGELELDDGHGNVLSVPKGRSAFLSAADSDVRAGGRGSAYRATDGLDGTDGPTGSTGTR